MYTRHYFSFDDVKISYLSSGAAHRTIVFIHGSCCSASDWLPQFESSGLAGNYRMIAVDLPGHGKSGWAKSNPQMYRLSSFAKLIYALVDHLGLKEFILAGLSLGTSIIGEMKFPISGCKGIVLTSPTIINHDILPADILTPGPYGHVLVAEDPSENDLTAYIKSHLSNQKIAELYKNSYRGTDPAFRKELGLLMAEGDWSDEVANLSAWDLPMKIIFGKNESLLKTDYISRQVPHWKKKVSFAEGAGHMVNQENPERFNQILLDFAKESFK